MKYDVLKDVVVDGSAYPAGSSVTINHDKVDRLIMLGFLAVAAKPAPKKRTRRTEVADFELTSN